MKQWYIWWIARQKFVNGQWQYSGLWWPMKYYTDHEAWREEFDITRNNLDAKVYRMVWTGAEWQYDTRLLA